MSTLEKIQQAVAASLTKAVGGEFVVHAKDLSRPPKPDMGDLSFACFAAAASKKMQPVQLAKEIAEFGEKPDYVREFRAVGPYVNVFLDRRAFNAAVLKEVQEHGIEYGAVDAEDGGHVMIEYGSPNTHKEVHVGHLRNFALGLAVERLLRAAGKSVISVNYIGDVGAHVAKWLWYYDKVRRGDVPDAQEITDDDIRHFGKIYTDATRLAEQEGDKAAQEISLVLQALERHDPVWEQLWLTTRDLCLAQMKEIFIELDIRFERTYLESEVEHVGKSLVKALQADGIAETGERGAVIVNLENENLGTFLVLKSDGTALYSTKELALAQKKFAEFPDVEQSIHVVDNRQSLYFKQLFATLRRMGFDRSMVHLGYEFVTLKEGAMSSRRGNIVTYEDFRDEMISMVSDGTRSRHPQWDDARIGDVAWTVCEGAMKFWMLKQDNDKPITFDMAAATSFDGFTGPYVQYAYARLSSILAKAGDEFSAEVFAPGMGEDEELDPGGDAAKYTSGSDDANEYALLRAIADLPAVVVAAAADYRPSLLCQYLFDLAQSSNAFYRDVPVLSAENPGDRRRRLAIVATARVAIANGLRILGIRVSEEM